MAFIEMRDNGIGQRTGFFRIHGHVSDLISSSEINMVTLAPCGS
jgi:hypothetical protein